MPRYSTLLLSAALLLVGSEARAAVILQPATAHISFSGPDGVTFYGWVQNDQSILVEQPISFLVGVGTAARVDVNTQSLYTLGIRGSVLPVSRISSLLPVEYQKRALTTSDVRKIEVSIVQNSRVVPFNGVGMLTFTPLDADSLGDDALVPLPNVLNAQWASAGPVVSQCSFGQYQRDLLQGAYAVQVQVDYRLTAGFRIESSYTVSDFLGTIESSRIDPTGDQEGLIEKGGLPIAGFSGDAISGLAVEASTSVSVGTDWDQRVDANLMGHVKQADLEAALRRDIDQSLRRLVSNKLSCTVSESGAQCGSATPQLIRLRDGWVTPGDITKHIREQHAHLEHDASEAFKVFNSTYSRDVNNFSLETFNDQIAKSSGTDIDASGEGTDGFFSFLFNSKDRNKFDEIVASLKQTNYAEAERKFQAYYEGQMRDHSLSDSDYRDVLEGNIKQPLRLQLAQAAAGTTDRSVKITAFQQVTVPARYSALHVYSSYGNAEQVPGMDFAGCRANP